jgi:hypothetical protein
MLRGDRSHSRATRVSRDPPRARPPSFLPPRIPLPPSRLTHPPCPSARVGLAEAVRVAHRAHLRREQLEVPLVEAALDGVDLRGRQLLPCRNRSLRRLAAVNLVPERPPRRQKRSHARIEKMRGPRKGSIRRLRECEVWSAHPMQPISESESMKVTEQWNTVLCSTVAVACRCTRQGTHAKLGFCFGPRATVCYRGRSDHDDTTLTTYNAVQRRSLTTRAPPPGPRNRDGPEDSRTGGTAPPTTAQARYQV